MSLEHLGIHKAQCKRSNSHRSWYFHEIEYGLALEQFQIVECVNRMPQCVIRHMTERPHRALLRLTARRYRLFGLREPI